MKRCRHLSPIRTACFLFIAAALCAPAQQDTTPPPPAPTATAVDELKQDPLITTGTLDNGLHYIIRPTKEPAGRASLRLYVHVGSLAENDENTGFSHLLEHMVFNGSRSYKRGELIPVMQKLGLGFGGDANAYTGLQETVYMLELPNLEEKTVDTALTIMRDFADGATLEDDDIDKERGIVISEMHARDSATFRARIAFLEQITEGTRLAKYLPIGKEEVLRHGAPELVRQHYRNFYTSDNMTLLIVGDVKPTDAEAWIKQHFDSMEARQPAAKPAMGALVPPTEPVKLIPNVEEANTTIHLSIVKPYTEKKDSAQQRIKDLPLELACAMVNRRLKRLTHTETCPFTTSGIETQDLCETVDLRALVIKCKPEKWQSAVDCCVQQLRQAIVGGFDAAEVKEATEALCANLEQACATWETVPASTMADRIIEAISDKEILTDPYEEMRVLAPMIRQIRENPEICRQALQDAFDLHHPLLTMIGNIPADVKPAALRNQFDKALQAPLPERKAESVKPFAYETIGMPGTVTRQEKSDDLGITTLSLSNGVRVNLKPVDFRKGSICVTAAVSGGRLALPPTPGLAAMVQAVMGRGGLREHSYDDLERLLASKHVTLDFDMDFTHFLFSGTTCAQDLELQCKLLAAAILHSGYREDGEVVLRRSLDNTYRELETTPEGVLAVQSNRIMFGNNVLFTVPQKAEIEACSAKVVEQVMEPLLNKNYVEVSLVGDFDVATVVPVLERTFGAMPNRDAEPCKLSPEQRRVSTQPWAQRRFLEYPTQLDKTIVARVHAAGNGRDFRRNRRLQVLASIVRDKLLNSLRAAMGESYSPRVQVRTNSDFDDVALLTTMSAGVKANRAKVCAAMEDICNQVGQGAISEDEFRRAILPIRAAAQKDLVSPSYWQNQLIDFQSEPERPALMRDFIEDINSMSVDEVRAVAREVFGPSEASADFFFVVPEGTQQEEDGKSAAPSPAP